MSERSQILDNAAVIQLMNERAALKLKLDSAEREIERLKEFEWMYKDLCK